MAANDRQGRVEAKMQPTQFRHVNRDFKVVGFIGPIGAPGVVQGPVGPIMFTRALEAYASFF